MTEILEYTKRSICVAQINIIDSLTSMINSELLNF